MRGQDQGRKPLVKVSCTRPHFTRQPREGEKKEREREGGGEEMGRGGKKQNKAAQKATSPRVASAQACAAFVLGLSSCLAAASAC